MSSKNVREKRYIFLGIFFLAVVLVFSFNGWGARLLASLLGVSANKNSEKPTQDAVYYEYPLFYDSGQIYDAAVAQIKTSFDANGKPEPVVQVGSKFYTKSILADLPPTNIYEQSSTGGKTEVLLAPAASKIIGSLSLSDDKIDFGLNWAEESGWTAEKIITLANLADSSSTYALSFKCCGLGEDKATQGIKTLLVEPRIVVGPKGTASIGLAVSIQKNSEIPNGRYNGFLEISSGAETFTVPVSFFKGYGIRVYYSGGVPNVLKFYKNNLTEIVVFPGRNNDSTLFYLTEAGPWFIEGMWSGDEDAIAKHVLKSGLQTNQPIVNFTLNKSDANREITFNLTKPSGAAFKYTPPFVYKFSHRSSGHGLNVIIPSGLVGSQIKLRVSEIGQDYNFSGVASYSGGDNLAVHLYQLTGGVRNDKFIANKAGDFAVKELVGFQNRFLEQTAYAFIGGCTSEYKFNGAVGYGCAYFSKQNISLPAGGMRKLFVFNSNSLDIAASPYPDYPSFNILLALDASENFFAKNLARSEQYYVDGSNVYSWSRGGFSFLEVKPEKSFSNVLYAGGLAFDASRWQNFADKEIKLVSGYSDEWLTKGGFPGGARAIYTLKRGNVKVLSGDFRSAESVSLPPQSPAGNYEFRLERETFINEIAVKAATVSTFKITNLNSYLARPRDENPPALTKLFITAGGFLENVIDTTFYNMLVFAIDPVPGLLSSGVMPDVITSVKLEVATDGLNWRERPLTEIGAGQYSAVVNVPGDPVPAGHLYSFRIFAKDLANNTFTYTFELPTGRGLKDNQAPNVSVKSPSEGAFLSGQANVNVEAGDNIGIAKVELYLDDILIDVKATAPYAFIFDTAAFVDGSYVLESKAYDIADNVSVSESVRVKLDNSPPEISVDSPTNDSIVLGTIVNIFAGTSDNESVKEVEIYLDGKVLLGSDSVFPYIINWDSTSVPDGKHAIFAKVTDSAGNINTSTIVSVTVENRRRWGGGAVSAPTIRPSSK